MNRCIKLYITFGNKRKLTVNFGREDSELNWKGLTGERGGGNLNVLYLGTEKDCGRSMAYGENIRGGDLSGSIILAERLQEIASSFGRMEKYILQREHLL